MILLRIRHGQNPYLHTHHHHNIIIGISKSYAFVGCGILVGVTYLVQGTLHTHMRIASFMIYGHYKMVCQNLSLWHGLWSGQRLS